MLAGMHQAVFERSSVLLALGAVQADTLDHRRHFHEIGPSAGDKEQFEFLCHLKTPEARIPARSAGTVQFHDLLT